METKKLGLALFCFSLTCALAACSGNTDQPAPDLKEEKTIVAETPTVETPAVFQEPELWKPFRIQEKAVSTGEIFDRLEAGDDFYLAFDNCTLNDEGWDGDADPLAGIRCDYSYYSKKSERGLQFTGILESTGAIFTAVGSLTLPDNSDDRANVSVWGVPFELDSQGNIFDGSNNQIGYVGLGSVPMMEEEIK